MVNGMYVYTRKGGDEVERPYEKPVVVPQQDRDRWLASANGLRGEGVYGQSDRGYKAFHRI